MKGLSIKSKITLWFAIALFFIAFLMISLMILISSSALQSNVKMQLKKAVYTNMDEVEYIPQNSIEHDDGDQYIPYGNGYIEIDDDFSTHANGVYCALYDSNNNIIYGNNTLLSGTVTVQHENEKLQTFVYNNEKYYIYDIPVPGDNTNTLWIRGIISAKEGVTVLSSIINFSLLLIPLLSILAIVVGYSIAGRCLKPIKDITHAVETINEGKDLSKRINLKEGTDELHHLAQTFDHMFDRLEASFEKERQFSADASHELRTPVAVILAQCEYALEQPLEATEYIETLEVIQRHTKRMSALVSELLTFTRLDSQNTTITKETLNLSEIIKTLCKDAAIINDKQITLSTEIEPNIMVYGNQGLLSQLFLNLLSNAYRYGKINGTIMVSLRSRNQWVELSVTDNGIGIDEKHLDKIWHRFYQVDSSRKTEGTGLGLAIVNQIAQFHEGNMKVTSTLGKGSTFTFLMPSSSKDQ